jgi:hypothetical protein
MIHKKVIEVLEMNENKISTDLDKLNFTELSSMI